MEKGNSKGGFDYQIFWLGVEGIMDKSSKCEGNSKESITLWYLNVYFGTDSKNKSISALCRVRTIRFSQ